MPWIKRRQLSVAAIGGLAIGAAFVIMFAVAMPAISKSPMSNHTLNYGTSMPSSYYVNDCNLPSGSVINTGSIKERSWVSVVRLDHAFYFRPDSKIPCTILTPGLAAKIPALSTAINGAEGCLSGTEVCEVSYGISVVGDAEDYELTVTKQEASDILGSVRFGEYNDALLASGDRFYFARFNSLDANASRGAQIEARFLDAFPSTPVLISAGETLNYTILLKTWATYGGPAKIDLSAFLSASDSGLRVQLEPSSLEIPERSEVRSVLKLTASNDAREGLYDVSVGGKINDDGLLPSGPCDYGNCVIKVGKSDWHIQTFGKDSLMAMGGPGEIPSWLSLDLGTDKETYAPGDPITIEAYLVNDGMRGVTLDPTRLMINIADSNGNPVYGIDSYDFDDTRTITIEPGSKLLIARPFVWDQTTGSYDTEQVQVPEGGYHLTAYFAGYKNAILNGEHRIVISPAVQ